mgnify:CR=1 FL=1
MSFFQTEIRHDLQTHLPQYGCLLKLKRLNWKDFSVRINMEMCL